MDATQDDPLARPAKGRMTREQRGLMVAVLAAFFGIAVGGPALTRLERRRRDLQSRVVRQSRDARARFERTRRDARRKLRRLGGGSIFR